jgi:uncharacterized protein YecE (DUF72 family)
MIIQFLVGTASWTDPTLVKSDLFYSSAVKTPAERLAFYADHFPTVEVDSSYYALPSERNAELWAERTPPGFVFNIKAFSWLTQHTAETSRLPKAIKELLPESLRATPRIKAPPRPALELAFQMFWSALQPLRAAGKLGYLLFQFPPYVTFRLSNFDYIATLKDWMPGAPIAIEFRHPSWLGSESARAETLRFLRDHELALVAIDTPPEVGLPSVFEATTDDAYIRFHGRNRESWFKRDGGAAERFKYLYAERELGEWAGRLKRLDGVNHAFVIFNNCYSNFGIMNATTMKSLLTGP